MHKEKHNKKEKREEKERDVTQIRIRGEEEKRDEIRWFRGDGQVEDGKCGRTGGNGNGCGNFVVEMMVRASGKGKGEEGERICR